MHNSVIKTKPTGAGPGRARRPGVKRSSSITLVAFAALVVLFGCKRSPQAPAEKPKPQSLVIASYGGAWQEAQRKAMFGPFSRARNVQVKDVEYAGQYAKVKQMVSTKTVEWDIIDVEGNMMILGAKDGILEPIDYSIVPKSQLLPEAVHPYGVGIVAWSWVLAWKKGTLNEKQQANPWQTFFSPNELPGARGLRNDPRRVLEIALLSDRVPREKLYPLDTDRAFRVLSKFRTQMKDLGFKIIWWDAYAQSPILLRDGEVALSAGANGRIADAVKEGIPLEFTWVDSIVDLDWWIIPKGTPKKQLCMDFIAFASSAQPQADITKYIPYGPVNTNAFALIGSDRLKQLPTFPGNFAKAVVFDTQWWADNNDKVTEQWNRWRTEAP